MHLTNPEIFAQFRREGHVGGSLVDFEEPSRLAGRPRQHLGRAKQLGVLQ